MKKKIFLVAGASIALALALVSCNSKKGGKSLSVYYNTGFNDLSLVAVEESKNKLSSVRFYYDDNYYEINPVYNKSKMTEALVYSSIDFEIKSNVVEEMNKYFQLGETTFLKIYDNNVTIWNMGVEYTISKSAKVTGDLTALKKKNDLKFEGVDVKYSNGEINISNTEYAYSISFKDGFSFSLSTANYVTGKPLEEALGVSVKNEKNKIVLNENRGYQERKEVFDLDDNGLIKSSKIYDITDRGEKLAGKTICGYSNNKLTDYYDYYLEDRGYELDKYVKYEYDANRTKYVETTYDDRFIKEEGLEAHYNNLGIIDYDEEIEYNHYGFESDRNKTVYTFEKTDGYVSYTTAGVDENGDVSYKEEIRYEKNKKSEITTYSYGIYIEEDIYDDSGRNIKEVTKNKANATAPEVIVEETEYTFDSKGRELSRMKYTYSNSTKILTRKTDYTYEDLKIINETIYYNNGEVSSKEKHERTYDSKGNQISSIVYNLDSNGEYKVYSKYEYSYNSNGKIEEEVYTRGNNVATTTWTYDSNGEISKKTKVDGAIKNEYEYKNGLIVKECEYVKSNKDNKYYLTESKEYSSDKMIQIEYNYSDNGEISSSEKSEFVYENDLPKSVTYYSYNTSTKNYDKYYDELNEFDEDGFVVCYYEINTDENTNMKYEVSYNELHQCIGNKEYVYSNNNYVLNREDILSYDAEHRVTEEIQIQYQNGAVSGKSKDSFDYVNKKIKRYDFNLTTNDWELTSEYDM